MQNGQDVLVYAPRRYGKSSLVLRAGQRAIRKGDPRRLLRPDADADEGALRGRAREDDLQRPRDRPRGRRSSGRRGSSAASASRRRWRSTPIDGSLRFVFHAGRQRAAIDDTIEALLALPGQIAAERERRAVARLRRVPGDPHARPPLPQPHARGLPGAARGRARLPRAASATCSSASSTTRTSPSGGARSASRSAPIEPAAFARFLRQRFEETERAIDDDALGRLLEATGGHPYGTQELAYFLWELVPTGHFARRGDVEAALEQVLRSEHNHFAKLWDDAPHAQRLVMLALAEEPTRSLYAADYAERHDLPAKPALQRAIGALVTKEIAGARRRPRLPDRRAVLRGLAPRRAGGRRPAGRAPRPLSPTSRARDPRRPPRPRRG